MNLDVHDLRRLVERTSAHAERGLETAYLLERVSECVPLGDLHTQLQEERRRVVDSVDDLEAATVGLRALLTTMTELDVYDVDELVETRLEQVQRMRDELLERREATVQAVTLETAAINALPAPPEEDAVDHAPDWSAS